MYAISNLVAFLLASFVLNYNPFRCILPGDELRLQS